MGLAGLRLLAKSDVLAAFEGAIDCLRAVARDAAERDRELVGARREIAREAAALLRFIGRLLAEDAGRKARQIDRESAWFELFEIWLDDDAGVVLGFEEWLGKAAAPGADRRLVVRLASDALADLPIPFPHRGEPDARRAVIEASRFRLESLIAGLLAADDRHGYALAVSGNRLRKGGNSAGLVEALLRTGDSGAAVLLAQRALEDRGEAQPARLHALLDEALRTRTQGREVRQHLETAFLRHPTEAAFHAVKRAVPREQWPQVRSRLLGHLQKHKREPSLTFRLYWNEGLLLDADGLVATQPVDPDVLVGAARTLAARDAAIAAGWMLVAAHRLADAHPRSRGDDVVDLLGRVRDLAARCGRPEGFRRAIRAFRSRHAHAQDLLALVARAGL